MTRPLSRLVAIGVAAAAFAVPLGAQNAVVQQGWNPQQILRTETFVKPPADVERMIMTPRTDISFTTPSPDRKWFLRALSNDRGDIDAYGKSHINLGGLQIDTKANRARTVTTSTRYGLTLVDPRTHGDEDDRDAEGRDALGADLVADRHADRLHRELRRRVAHLRRRRRDGQIGADHQDAAARHARHGPRLDGRRQEHRHRAGSRRSRPGADARQANGVEDGPQVRLTESRALPQVIHPSLLEDPHDKALLTYYTTGQLAVIDVKSKTVKKIGAPDDDSRGRCVARRSVLPRHAHGRAVLVHRAGRELRIGAGAVGRDRQGDRDAEQDAAARRWTRRHDDPDAPPAGRGGAAQPATDTGKRNIQWNPVGPGPRVPAVGVRRRRSAARERRRSRRRGSRRPAPRSAADERSLHELARRRSGRATRR